MTVEIITACTSHYPDPISFAAGEEIQAERGDPEFPGWFWCRAPSGKEGWVHHSFLAGTEGTTVSIRDYTAVELTVAAGGRGRLLRSLDGWSFVRMDSGEEGWIPQSHAILTNGESTLSVPTGDAGSAPRA